MPLSSEFPQRRRFAGAPAARALLAFFALLAFSRLAMAWGSTMDPVFVFYPRDFCSGERIALEVWNRDEQRWGKHPSHPVIPADSCQLEDAGVLLNEIRWRCLEEDRSDPNQGWIVGVRVFEAAVMQRCDVARSGSGFGETAIHVSTPKFGETISDVNPRVAIEGSVWIGGSAGAEYDVVIAIDTSAPESDRADATPIESTPSDRSPSQLAPTNPLAAQVRAARRFVDSLEDRLGEVRVGIVSFPGLDPNAAGRETGGGDAAPVSESETLFARRELPLTDDARAIERALERLLDRDPAGPMSFTDGLALAVDELFRPPGWAGAVRPGARRIVILGADGSGGFPFGPSAQADRDFRERNVERARRASLRGVVFHLFALGGLSEKPPAFIDEMLANSASSFTRVQSPDLGNFFTDQVSMPYLEGVSIRYAATGEPIRDLSYAADGRFSALANLLPGENHLVVRARTSDGDEREHPLRVDFDASAYREHLLAEEAARIRRTRSKHLVIRVED